MPSNDQCWSVCLSSSMRRAATYWQRILTAGIPDGVKTLTMVRQRGVEAQKCRRRRLIRSLVFSRGRALMKLGGPTAGS